MKKLLPFMAILIGEFGCVSENVPYTVAERYFVRNNYKILKKEETIITEKTKFNEIFGIATIMGINGKPTEIDFNWQFVYYIILLETAYETKISVLKLKVNSKNQLVLYYKIKKGRQQSYTTVPNLIIIINNGYKRKTIISVEK